MEIFGMEKLSLVDYDGKVAATLFTGACNFKCGFCHNSPLVTGVNDLQSQDIDEVFSYLENGKAGNTYNWFGWGSWNIANTGFNLLNGYQSIANLTATSPVSNGPKMYKVIGINRIANN